MKQALKITVFFLVLLGSCFSGYAQSGIAEFIFSATNDKELDLYTNQISYLSKQSYRLSPIREMEYRGQTNEVGANKVEHGLRLSPANPLEVRYSRKVFSSYRNLLSLEKEIAFNELLASRYLLVADLLYTNELKNIRAGIVQTIDTRISILEKQNTSGFFDAEEYVKLKLEQMEEYADLQTVEFYLDQKKTEIDKLAGNNIGHFHSPNWTYDKVISISRIESLLDSLLQQPLFNNLQAYGREKITFAENEYKLKKWDINPGFIQGSYRQHQNIENRNPFGVNIGITIPVFNPNKGKIAEQRLEILEAENELVLEKLEAEEELERLLLSLQNLLARHNNLEEQMSTYDIDKLLSGVNILNRENPTIRLKFDAQLLKIQKVQLEVKKEIFETYINLLLTADLLGQRPLLNYLSEDLKSL